MMNGIRPVARRAAISLALAAATAYAGLTPASATEPGQRIATLEDCHPRAVIVPGVDDVVRQKVPAQFELVRDPVGRPLLAVVASRCERFAVENTSRRSTYALFMAVIESPDGAGCLMQWPLVRSVKPDVVPLCNFYLLFATFDNRAMVKRVRALVPDAPIRYVTRSVYSQHAVELARVGAHFEFRAGPRTSSRFTLSGEVREGTAPTAATFFLWFASASGTVRFREDFADLTIGQMDATLRPAPNSEMAQLLGTHTPMAIAGLAFRFHHDELRFLPSEPS